MSELQRFCYPVTVRKAVPNFFHSFFLFSEQICDSLIILLWARKLRSGFSQLSTDSFLKPVPADILKSNEFLNHKNHLNCSNANANMWAFIVILLLGWLRSHDAGLFGLLLLIYSPNRPYYVFVVPTVDIASYYLMYTSKKWTQSLPSTWEITHNRKHTTTTTTTQP